MLLQTLELLVFTSFFNIVEIDKYNCKYLF